MTLIAVAFPILPGKTDAWRSWMGDLNGSRRAEFDESRRNAGVHERSFLQSTPMGDVAIVTLEGDDPGRAFGKMLGANDEFTKWFAAKAKDVHGVDLTPRLDVSIPELVVDSDRVPATA